MDVRGTTLYALVSSTVSSVDGVPYKTQTPAVSAFLGTMADFIFKMNNRIATASNTLISGGSAGAVAIAGGGISATTVTGFVQGWPFLLSGVTGAFSGQPPSSVSTNSTQVRKVLVVLTFSALPVASSIANAATVNFVVGSAWTTAASSVLSGGVSATFNSVPLPKASGSDVPVGWLNIPNSFAASAGLADHMLITNYREVQGFNMTMIMQGMAQP